MEKLYTFEIYDKNGNVLLSYKNISYNYIEKFLGVYYNNTILKYGYEYKILEAL